MTMCKRNHKEIIYEDGVCPLCAEILVSRHARDAIIELEKELDYAYRKIENMEATWTPRLDKLQDAFNADEEGEK